MSWLAPFVAADDWIERSTDAISALQGCQAKFLTLDSLYFSLTVVQLQPDQLIDRLPLPPPGASARHPDLDVHEAAVRAKSVVRAQIVLRQVTAARPNLPDLPRAASIDRDSRADSETVASGLLEL